MIVSVSVSVSAAVAMAVVAVAVVASVITYVVRLRAQVAEFKAQWRDAANWCETWSERTDEAARACRKMEPYVPAKVFAEATKEVYF